ncbi:PTPA-CTERM sorting domain-containing protein [Leptolyngbya sp. DQ-M1]|uniref:PTPA-CTERM sorting domain-containing protein n=1 Tax=Leptolyngbya sp. DQ-M1 TaxID=2933920 RepID=UPI003299E5D5
MNFKSISLGAAIAATATVALSTATPAQAAGLTGALSIDIGGKVNSVKNTGVDLVNTAFTLQAAPGSALSGTFANYAGGSVTLKDLSFSPALVSNGSPVDVTLNIPSFLTLEKSGQQTITFTLTKLLSASFRDIGNLGDSFGNFDAQLQGVFQPSGIGNSPTGDSIVSFRLRNNSNGGSIELTPVPTPALLPGLIGFGVAAFRKRKGEASPEAEPGTVEVKA